MTQTCTEVGRFRISPLSKPHRDGGFLASVSVQRGAGSATSDRIFRFERLFASAAEALTYARAQGIAWAHERNT